jgi:hypothetical protein
MPPSTRTPTEYDKGAALAAARRFADARQVFEEAARLVPTDGHLAAGVAIFGDLAAKRISEDGVQRLFRVTQHANAQRADQWETPVGGNDARVRRCGPWCVGICSLATS